MKKLWPRLLIGFVLVMALTTVVSLRFSQKSYASVGPQRAVLAATSGTATNCDNLKLGTPGLTIDCSGGKNPIYALLQFVVNWVVRLLLVLAVIAIVVSGIQYTTSQGNPEGVKGAKSRLTNAIVGLILLSLMFVILRIFGIG